MLQNDEPVESTMQVEHDNLAPTGTVRILVEMGFSEKLARRALDRTAWDVEAAADWCCMHLDEEDTIPDITPQVQRSVEASFEVRISHFQLMA